MRVAFFGTPDYAVPTLDALVEAGHEVVTVVAQPDRPAGRGRRLQSPPTVVRARALGIQTRQPKAVRSGPFPERFGALDLDVGVVVAYGRILTEHILSVPRLGCVNGHGSLLPRWRGAAPIEWSILAGDAVTGVTTMQMDVGLDTGDVLLERVLAIGPEETGGQLRVRMAQLTAALIVETLDQLDQITPRPQDPDAATHAPPLNRDHGRIDWSRSGQQIHDQVRALTPRPGAWATLRGERFKVHATRPQMDSDLQGAPGEILVADKRLIVACGEGAVEILTAQLPNKRPLPARDIVNGARLTVADVLT